MFTRTLLVCALALGLAACGSETAETTAADPATDTQTAGTLVDAPSIPSGTYTIDASHSRMEFKVRHLGISTVSGTFEDVSGTVTVRDGLGSLQASAVIDASSISTDNDDRDDHLRSADFFDVEQYPEISFQSTELRAGDGGDYVLVGELTMHGVTRPVELDVEYVGAATSPQGVEKVAFTAEGEINRTEWGLTWNAALEAGGVVVSEEVELELDVQADLQGAEAVEDASAEA